MSLVEKYYRIKLAKLGYPVEDINFRLSSSQGDGMAMYGKIPNINTLVDRLLDGYVCIIAKQAIEKADISISIARNDYATHYSHYNTMKVHVEYGSFGETLDAFEQQCYDIFQNKLADDIREVSKSLEHDGYELIDSTPFETEEVKVYRTKRFEVKLLEHPDADFSLDLMEESDVEDILDQFVSGDLRYFGVEVQISSLDGLELGSASIWSMTNSKSNPDKTYSGYRKDLVSEAIQQARNTLSSLQLKAA